MLSTTRSLGSIGALALILSAGVVPPAASGATPAPKSCTGDEYHQFDFWIGKWKVYDRGTKHLAGTNNVTREFGGCVIQEHWKGAESGSIGSSFNTYDATRKVWHQTWVDDLGQLLLLNGGLKNGAMVLSQTGPGRKVKIVMQRITWTPMKNGDVRQNWEMSKDLGKTWLSVFDGIYVKDDT